LSQIYIIPLYGITLDYVGVSEKLAMIATSAGIDDCCRTLNSIIALETGGGMGDFLRQRDNIPNPGAPARSAGGV
jgi:hypothetical protein